MRATHTAYEDIPYINIRKSEYDLCVVILTDIFSIPQLFVPKKVDISCLLLYSSRKVFFCIIDILKATEEHITIESQLRGVTNDYKFSTFNAT